MAEIIVKETEIKVIEVLAQGPAGVQGPPGEAGGDTGRVTQIYTAGTDLGGHRVVYAHNGFARYASADNADTACEIVGITTHAAAPYADIQVLTAGPIEDVSFSWDVTKPIFLGLNGLLTQTVDMAWQFIRIVGYPTGTASMMVCMEEPLFL